MPRWTNNTRTPLEILRNNAGYTREEAAVLMGIGMMSLERYEKGRGEMTFSIGEKMANLYKVSFDDIRRAAAATWKKKEDKRKKQKTVQEIMLQRNQRISPQMLIEEALAESKKWKNSEK